MAKKNVKVTGEPKIPVKRILKKNDELDNLILFISMVNIQTFYLKDNEAYPDIKGMFNPLFNESNRVVDAFDRFYFTQRKLDNYENYKYELAAVVKKIMICDNFDEIKSLVNALAVIPAESKEVK